MNPRPETQVKELLVVDDEADFRFLFRKYFTRRGFKVHEAEDGIAALEVFEVHGGTLDLVLTDIRMPRMGGEELVRELRRQSPSLPILGITGHADLRDKLAILDTGAYYYLEKPVEHWSLVEPLVENAIRLYRRELEIERKRRAETQIARLLRGYILQSPVGKSHYTAEATDGAGADRAFELDIAFEPIEIASPSGDYVEWFVRGGREVVFYMADASGHNDLVASFTACLSNMVLHRMHHGQQPTVEELISGIDGALDTLRMAGALGHERYLTLFIGAIDLATGHLSYVNAGHQDVLVVRDGAEVERLGASCKPVGLNARFHGVVEAVDRPLDPGDLLFLYTDGVSELLGDGDARLGMGRLEDLLAEVYGRGAQGVVDDVVAALHRHVGEHGFEDDTTLMAIQLSKA